MKKMLVKVLAEAGRIIGALPAVRSRFQVRRRQRSAQRPDKLHADRGYFGTLIDSREAANSRP